MTTAIATKLDGIARLGFRGIDVAQVTGTRPETVSRWSSGKNAPQGDNLRRLLEFDYVVQRLAELFKPDEARLWMFSRHKLLDGQVPAELIQAGKVDDVLRAIDQLADGVYL